MQHPTGDNLQPVWVLAVQARGVLVATVDLPWPDLELRTAPHPATIENRGENWFIAQYHLHATEPKEAAALLTKIGLRFEELSVPLDEELATLGIETVRHAGASAWWVQGEDVRVHRAKDDVWW